VIGLGLWVGSAAFASGWVQVDAATGRCAPTHPPRHRVFPVSDTFAKREDVAQVEAALRQQAMTNLEATTCSGRTPAQCDRIKAAAGMQVVIDLDRRLACGAALVAVEVVDDPDGLAAQEAELARAARALRTATPSISGLEARWSSGCGAGPAGERVAALLRQGFIGAGGQVSAGQGDRVIAQLSPGDPTAVELWRYAAGGPGELVASARVSRAWLGVIDSPPDACHGSPAPGPNGGWRDGQNGLRVQLHMPTTAGLCAGERLSAEIRPSGPAAVQLWSVGRTGEAWLTWSSSTTGVVERSATIELEAAFVPALGEEQLVVLAAARAQDLPRGAEGCRLPRLPTPPASVAVASAPFTVLPPGVARCSALPPTGPTWAEWQAAPLCE
jgi:hypothetical protein